ncbi:MAG: nitroreductase family protein [Phocaeicola sp.]|uniref:nitroreductase family protein n=1 Tax=Phocaeicola sp. TaxID=2773926 RepID=UPI003FA107F6
MKNLFVTVLTVLTLLMPSCQSKAQSDATTETVPQNDGKNVVVETIMARRSIRKYHPQAVNRDTMNIVLKCGINAPSAMNVQDWEVRVVDNQEFLNGLTTIFKEKNKEMAERDKEMRNMFRNAPTVAFIAAKKDSKFSSVDCALMAENMMIAAKSMGIGSVCMAGPVEFLKGPDCADYLNKLGFSDDYELLLTIGFGYPAEEPAAKPRDESKCKFVD